MATTLTIKSMSADDLTKEMKKLEVDSASKISTAKTQLLLNKPKDGDARATACFFATLIMQLEYRPDWMIDTAGVDGITMTYNPEWVCGLTSDQLKGVLAHEIMHCTNKHATRQGWRDHTLFNVAADLAINHILKEAGFILPSYGCFPGQGSFVDVKPGLSAEEYYTHVAKMEEAKPGTFTGPDPFGCGGVMTPVNATGTPLEKNRLDQLDRRWQANVAAAVQLATKLGGLLPGIARIVEEVLKPAHHWEEELIQYMTRKNYSGHNWHRPARRHVHRGMYLPSLQSKEMGHVICVLDTSGSITKETLRRFASEVTDIASRAGRVTVLYHHSAVYKVDEWSPELGQIKITGAVSGGTDHIPVFEWIDKLPEKPEVVVLLTDMESSFPSTKPDYDVLWASINQKAKAPFGSMIYIPNI